MSNSKFSEYESESFSEVIDNIRKVHQCPLFIRQNTNVQSLDTREVEPREDKKSQAEKWAEVETEMSRSLRSTWKRKSKENILGEKYRSG